MSTVRAGAPLACILLSVLVGAVGSGVAMPVMPALIGELSGASLAQSARISGWLVALFAATQFLAVPVLGRLGDAFGRRPVLLLSLAALAADCILMGMARSLGWLFAARAISGACCATGAISAAYLADTSAPEMRARRFGLLAAAWGVGIFVGPAVGGVLGQANARMPFFAAAALAGATALAGLLVLPESLPMAQRRAFSWRGLGPFASFARLRGIAPIGGLLASLLLFQVAYLTSHAVWPFFTTARFQWQPAQIGWSLALAGLAVALVQGALLGPTVARIGEERTAALGFLMVAATFIAIALASAEWMLYALILPYAIASIGASSLNSMLSKTVPANMQGEAQGLAASVANLAAVGTPLLMTSVFEAFTAEGSAVYFPGAPYLLGGLFALGGLTAFARLLRPGLARN
jgi:DHA1 family tetracycline resistance protein-like MFS transporter